MNIWVYFILSYFIGCIMFGYMIGRVFGKMDIRKGGSGNVGARNIGRSLNKSAFVATLLGDAGKAVAVILLGRSFGYSEEVQLIGFLFVLLGHIWPVTLSLNGGKGISSFLGGIIAFEPISVVIIIIGFIITYPLIRSFTIAGLLSFIMIPIVFYIQEHSYIEVAIVSLIITIIIFAHRSNIKERV